MIFLWSEDNLGWKDNTVVENRKKYGCIRHLTAILSLFFKSLFFCLILSLSFYFVAKMNRPASKLRKKHSVTCVIRLSHGCSTVPTYTAIVSILLLGGVGRRNMQANTRQNRTEYKLRKKRIEKSSIKPIQTKLNTDKSHLDMLSLVCLYFLMKTNVYDMILPLEMICSKWCIFQLAVF